MLRRGGVSNFHKKALHNTRKATRLAYKAADISGCVVREANLCVLDVCFYQVACGGGTLLCASTLESSLRSRCQVKSQ